MQTLNTIKKIKNYFKHVRTTDYSEFQSSRKQNKDSVTLAEIKEMFKHFVSIFLTSMLVKYVMRYVLLGNLVRSRIYSALKSEKN